jgi:hypothetical protein
MNDSRPITAVCDDLQRLLSGPLRDRDAVDELAAEVSVHPEGIAAVGILLRLLETNPEVEWGSPGPVVHAVEKFFRKGYEPLLLESVARAPTSHTLWMVNRVANGVDSGLREQFLAAMRAAESREDVAAEVRATATRFLEFQSKKK